MREPFRGAKLKIERAYEHINQLDAEIRNLSMSDYYTLGPEKDPETGQDGLKFSITKSLPDRVATIIGDAIHNLRSALDLAVCEIFIRQMGGKTPKRVKFPFYDSRDGVINAIKGGEINLIPQVFIDYIVDVVKPYRGGNDALYALHDLDILDKHILLLPTVASGTFSFMGQSTEDDKNFSFIAGWFLIDPKGNGFIPFNNPMNLSANDQFQPALVVSLGHDLGTRNKPIIPMLVEYAKSISGILEDLENLYCI